MSVGDRRRVRRIARYLWICRGVETELLTPEEIKNLVIERGTLNAEEREIVNGHALTTIKMLESLPYPKHLARVPEFAAIFSMIPNQSSVNLK